MYGVYVSMYVICMFVLINSLIFLFSAVGPLNLIITLYPLCELIFDLSASLAQLTQSLSVMRKQSVSVSSVSHTVYKIGKNYALKW